MSIQVRVICYFPDHHEDHVKVDREEVYCQDGNYYSVVDVDVDELDDWNNEKYDSSKLRVIIEVPLEYCEFSAEVYGVMGTDDVLSIKYSGIEIISATLPGINDNFYDVDDNNEEAEMQIYKILASR